MIQRYSALKADTLVGELLFLRVAAVDFASYLALGDCPAKTNLLDAFFKPYQQLANQRADYELNLAALKSRVISYSDGAATQVRFVAPHYWKDGP